ncbi:hypothetical protein E4T45_08689 [Aureobasidium sp. EXF-8846]|nr:hypothetical protein E4T45_08689 [Aureobasidium sp. EXF-8846]
MPQVVIVGAGIVGLILGQVLKLVRPICVTLRDFIANELLTSSQQDIPIKVLERDTSADDRGQGWAITLHWALPLLREMLPQELMDQIKRCRVDSQAPGDDAGSFKLINLKDCSEIQNTPTGERWRVNRGKLRLTLLEGLNDNIHWNRHVVDVEHHEDFAKVHCSDGEIHIADIVIGADGSGSAIRRFLCPEKHAVTPLPYRMLGVRTTLTREQVAPLRSIDQLLFQGCKSDTGNFLYCSLLEPSLRETSSCTVQFNISWPKSPNQEEVFSDNTSRLVALKLRARGFAPCLRDAIEAITEETPVSEIILADWNTPHWKRSGRVTLIGDAAHPMVMYRGEAGNFGIWDVYKLSKKLRRVNEGKAVIPNAIRDFEEEMMKQATDAILESRYACRDAHNWPVDQNSPLVTERKMPG